MGRETKTKPGLLRWRAGREEKKRELRAKISDLIGKRDRTKDLFQTAKYQRQIVALRTQILKINRRIDEITKRTSKMAKPKKAKRARNNKSGRSRGRRNNTGRKRRKRG